MDTADEDSRLLERWVAGETAAGSALVDRYFDAIARFFRNKVADSLDAQDDLVQMTFTACVEAGARFRGEGSFRSFLFSIAYNVLRRYYEKRRRDARVDFGTVSIHDLAKGPATLLGEAADRALVVAALRKLPVDVQTAFELHYWEGATVAEVAAVLDWPVGTVKSRLRRGRAQLRECLEAEPAPDDARAAALRSLGAAPDE
ncbi:MAG: sigma-70 family RNA polymerase sigma factor [Myxococcota bacterium]